MEQDFLGTFYLDIDVDHFLGQGNRQVSKSLRFIHVSFNISK